MRIKKSIISGYSVSILTSLFFLFSTDSGAIAQTSSVTISGNVKNGSTLSPIENVHVIIVQNSLGCATDSRGDFIIKGIEKGAYTIQASMTGFRAEQKRVNIGRESNIEINFILQPETYQIDSVNITAERKFRSLMYKPYTEPLSVVPAISNVGRTEIVKQGSLNVIDAMNYVPGGLTETRGRQVKQFFSVRGQTYPYPNYALNSVWQQEFEELPYFIPSSDIEEIEIVRTSAALLTGLSGMAGLINIKTRKYIKPETNIELEYGSYNSIHSHLSAGGKIGHFGIALGGGYDRFDGPEGKHAKEEMSDFYSQVRWEPTSKISVEADIFYLNGSRQLTIAEPPADKKYRDMIQSFDPYKAFLSNVKIVYRPNEKYSSELQLFYSDRNPIFIDEVKATSSSEKDLEWGANFIQSVSISKNNILRFGGLYDHWLAPNGKRFYTGKRCDTETFSGVIVDEYHLSRLTLDAGIRYTATYLNDYAAFNIEGEGSQFKNVTPIQDEWDSPVFQGNFGATYNINDRLNIYLNTAAGQVKPKPGALNEEFDELSNEMRLKSDIGVVQKFTGAGNITFTLFGVRQYNAIVLSGKTYTDTISGEVRELYVNRDQNQIGLELEYLMPRFFNLMKPFFNIALMKSKFEEDGTMVINKENPAIIASGGLFMEKKKLDLNILFKYVSRFENERFVPPADGPQPLGDFFTVDINTGYTFKGRIPVNLYFRVRNLTDIKFSTVNGYPDFGRMIYAGLKIKFIKDKLN